MWATPRPGHRTLTHPFVTMPPWPSTTPRHRPHDPSRTSSRCMASPSPPSATARVRCLAAGAALASATRGATPPVSAWRASPSWCSWAWTPVLARFVINWVWNQRRAGRPVPLEVPFVVSGVNAKVLPVPDEWLLTDFSRLAAWFRHFCPDGESLPLPEVQQVVWPDAAGRFPDDRDAIHGRQGTTHPRRRPAPLPAAVCRLPAAPRQATAHEAMTLSRGDPSSRWDWHWLRRDDSAECAGVHRPRTIGFVSWPSLRPRSDAHEQHRDEITALVLRHQGRSIAVFGSVAAARTPR